MDPWGIRRLKRLILKTLSVLAPRQDDKKPLAEYKNILAADVTEEQDSIKTPEDKLSCPYILFRSLKLS